MKKLTDYIGDEAIELWADLLEPLTKILGDKKVADVIQSGKPKMLIAKEILKEHSEEAKEILLRIDDTPIDGLNIVVRLVAVLADIGQSEEIKSFFGYAEQAKTDKKSSGSPMVSIVDDGK